MREKVAKNMFLSRFQFQKIGEKTFLDYFAHLIQKSRFGSVFELKCNLKNRVFESILISKS